MQITRIANEEASSPVQPDYEWLPFIRVDKHSAIILQAYHLLKTTGMPSRLHHFLFRPVSISRLAAFRILFGLLMAIECIGAVLIGRVAELFVDSKFNFPFIGFEWLAFLHGSWMQGYYVVMGLLGICVALGCRYRLAAPALALLWTLSYLAEKTHYNNHYYLMVLLTWLMAAVPAHRCYSLDVRWGKVAAAGCIPAWQHYLFIAQIGILYTCAAIAKMNPDWLQAMPLKLWMGRRTSLPVIGPLFRPAITPWLMAYFGLLFDLLVVPALLWRKTRVAAFFIGVVFHLSNSILFGIGTFPYLAIALCIFFAPPERVERVMARFSKKHALLPAIYKGQWYFVGIATLYLTFQLLLPLRHWFINGNVNWTEEGHRMAWRMMLRSKSGNITYRVVDKRSGVVVEDYPSMVLTPEQYHDLTTHPDIIWQYAQRLKKQEAAKGKEAAVYAIGCCSLNGKPCEPMIDPQTDLAAVAWNTFGHNTWITLHY